jgi:catechol 2,3-dioxygenase-like lactoylglutathione lyase family enzyme
MHLAHVTLIVPDYDEAIAHYTGELGFALVEDTALGDGKRWVRVAPPGSATSLVLARAVTDEQRAAIGRQARARARPPARRRVRPPGRTRVDVGRAL